MSTEGLACVGQDEVVILLETLPNEKHPPRDIFLFINSLYKDASIGPYYNFHNKHIVKFNFNEFPIINKCTYYFRCNKW